MIRKIIYGILFVIVVVALGMVAWALLANIVLVSRKASIFPVSPQAFGPVGIFDESDFPVQVDPKELGETSPLYGKLYISKEMSFFGTDDEYLYVTANIKNKEAVKISGMMLQSLVTNKVAIIPKGAPLFMLTRYNKEEDIYLKPGESAIVHTGKSPIGVSFKTNICSGYLNVANFTPPLATTYCPSPRMLVPNTLENIKKYGDSCMDAVASMRRCAYFDSENKFYKKVSKECRELLKLRFTYNYCVEKYKHTDKFYKGGIWHVYLGREGRLWKDKYEVIRLMDQNSRTVHAISY